MSEKCKCGLNAFRGTTMKEGPNKGRMFLGCPNFGNVDSKCNFFKWIDEIPNFSNSNTFITASNYVNSSSNRTSSSLKTKSLPFKKFKLVCTQFSACYGSGLKDELTSQLTA